MSVLCVGEVGLPVIAAECERFGLRCELVAPDAVIPGSYWGDSEAGLMGDRLYLRIDTPLHSALHEACHYVCMDHRRRLGLERDAGGNFDEENAVCYLQILWGTTIAAVGRERMLADMDSWGYTFRLGSAARWFEEDADDARAWLLRHGLIDPRGHLTGRVRA